MLFSSQIQNGSQIKFYQAGDVARAKWSTSQITLGNSEGSKLKAVAASRGDRFD
jgi:hypothetical protein